jgi:hypothetical protein
VSELFKIDMSSAASMRKSLNRAVEVTGAAEQVREAAGPTGDRTLPPRLTADQVLQDDPALAADLLKAISGTQDGDWFEADALLDELADRMEGRAPFLRGLADLGDPLDIDAHEEYYRGAGDDGDAGSGCRPRLEIRGAVARRWRYISDHPTVNADLSKALLRFRSTPRLVLPQ